MRGRAAAHIKAHLEASTTWAEAYPAARAADGSAMDGTTFDAVSCLANQDTRERAPGRASPALTLTASGQEKYFPLDAHAPQANPGALSSAHASERHGRARNTCKGFYLYLLFSLNLHPSIFSINEKKTPIYSYRFLAS